jgi:hypothetical protein
VNGDARRMAAQEAVMDAPATSSAVYYFHWGVVQISLANFLVIVAMIVVFVLALVLPFPGSRSDRGEHRSRSDDRP